MSRGYARCVTFFPGGRVLAFGTREAVVIWDMQSETRYDRLFRAGEVVESIAVAPDGRALAVGSSREYRVGFARLYHLTGCVKPNDSKRR